MAGHRWPQEPLAEMQAPNSRPNPAAMAELAAQTPPNLGALEAVGPQAASLGGITVTNLQPAAAAEEEDSAHLVAAVVAPIISKPRVRAEPARPVSQSYATQAGWQHDSI